MFTQFLMPLDRHFDSGLGATANSFFAAAKILDVDKYRNGFGNNRSRLPVFYLYRHANELYLKSILTILHRRFCSMYPRIQADDFPVINVNKKSKKIFAVHSIRLLYEKFLFLLTDNMTEIKSIAKTDWLSVPKELDEFIKIIDDADESSTMFRYPATLDKLNDSKKSSFKSIDIDDACIEMHNRSKNGKQGAKIFILENNAGEVVDTFIHDNDAMSEVLDALKNVAEILSGAQLGMQYEFLTVQN